MPAVCVLRPVGICCCQLHRPPTQGAAAIQEEETTHEGESHFHPYLLIPSTILHAFTPAHLVFTTTNAQGIISLSGSTESNGSFGNVIRQTGYQIHKLVLTP